MWEGRSHLPHRLVFNRITCTYSNEKSRSLPTHRRSRSSDTPHSLRKHVPGRCSPKRRSNRPQQDNLASQTSDTPTALALGVHPLASVVTHNLTGTHSSTHVNNIATRSVRVCSKSLTFYHVSHDLHSNLMHPNRHNSPNQKAYKNVSVYPTPFRLPQFC